MCYIVDNPGSVSCVMKENSQPPWFRAEQMVVLSSNRSSSPTSDAYTGTNEKRKGTVSRDFRPLFIWSKTLLGPLMNRGRQSCDTVPIYIYMETGHERRLAKEKTIYKTAVE